MNIDITAHRIDITEAVKSRFPAGQPKDPRQDPVPIRKLCCQFGRVNLTGWPAADEHGVFRKTGADLGADDMRPKWRAVTTCKLTSPVTGAGNIIIAD